MAYDDENYYQLRAEQEIELAQRAEHSEAVQAHYQLASAYLDLIHGDTPERAPGIFGS